MMGTAVLSENGLYRYRLERSWGESSTAPVTWVMLNPSVADAHVDDPTLTHCVTFTRQAGWGRLVVVNLFGLRSTDPGALSSAEDPVGPENLDHVRAALQEAGLIVAAWGAHPMALRSPIRLKLLDLAPVGVDVVCLGLAGGRHPRHPVRLGYSTPFVPFRLP
jgi:hypothetical protein